MEYGRSFIARLSVNNKSLVAVRSKYCNNHLVGYQRSVSTNQIVLTWPIERRQGYMSLFRWGSGERSLRECSVKATWRTLGCIRRIRRIHICRLLHRKPCETLRHRRWPSGNPHFHSHRNFNNAIGAEQYHSDCRSSTPGPAYMRSGVGPGSVWTADTLNIFLFPGQVRQVDWFSPVSRPCYDLTGQ